MYDPSAHANVNIFQLEKVRLKIFLHLHTAAVYTPVGVSIIEKHSNRFFIFSYLSRDEIQSWD